MNNVMTCAADCKHAGWVEYIGECDLPWLDIHISVAPDADLDDVITAFCHDEQEMIRINGWNFTFEKIGA